MLSGTLDRNDIFYPRQARSRPTADCRASTSAAANAAIGKSPIYFGVNSEYVTMLRSTTEARAATTRRPGADPVDVTPGAADSVHEVAVPHASTRLSAGAATYWTESLDDGAQVPQRIGRHYFDFSPRVTGPVFSRIFNAGATATRRSSNTSSSRPSRSTGSPRSTSSTASSRSRRHRPHRRRRHASSPTA